MRDDAVERVLDALLKGELSAADLTARRLSALVGKTTSLLYHHFGSLDGFLYAVSQRGYARIAERLVVPGVSAVERYATLAERYIDFALECPQLYALMFERRFDWTELRNSAQFGTSAGLLVWRATVADLASLGRNHPEDDARVLFAGLHGLASLALSGRANVGDLTVSDRDAAVRAARHLVTSLLDKP